MQEATQHPREWTLDEANETLPEVRDIVATAAAALERMQAARARHDVETARIAEASVRAGIARLLEMGIQVKSLRPGLIDFPSRLGDRVVLLCWRDDEDEVAHWHDMESGYAGRRPVPSVETVTG